MKLHHPNLWLLHFLLILFSPITAIGQTTTFEYDFTGDDDGTIISNDLNLIVPIEPLLRIDLYETSQTISQSGINAFIKAMEDYTTVRMQTYFTNTYGTNEFIFEKVQFQVLEHQGLELHSLRRRVFELEEESVSDVIEMEDQIYQQDDAEELRAYKALRDNDKAKGNRNLQSNTVYGTSFLLGGNFTFESLPAAPSKECNRKLKKFVEKHWSMMLEIQAQNHPELSPNAQLMTTAFIDSTDKPSANPSVGPSASPSFGPSQFPTVPPSHLPSNFPTTTTSPSAITPAPVVVPSPTEPTKIGNGINDVQKDDNKDKENTILPVLIPILSASMVVGLAAFLKQKYFPAAGFFSKRRNRDVLLEDQLREDEASDFDFESDKYGSSPASGLLKLASTKDTGDSDSLDVLETGTGSASANASTQSKEISRSDMDQVEAMRSPEPEAQPKVSSHNASHNNSQSQEYRSISTNETMKTENLVRTAQEDAWRNNVNVSVSTSSGSGARSFSTSTSTTPNQLTRNLNTSGNPTPPLSSGNVTFPIKINQDDSRSSASTPLFGDQGSGQGETPLSFNSCLNSSTNEGDRSKASAQVVPSPPRLETVTGANINSFKVNNSANTNRSLFRGGSTPSPKSSKSKPRKHTASPIIDVSPSKVSKEEFEKGWDVDLPFNWNPTPPTSDKKSKKKKERTPTDNKKSRREVEVEGSFPTFEMAEVPPLHKSNDQSRGPVHSQGRVHQRNSSHNGDSTLGSSTVGDSTYHTVHDIHPLDWSKGGSDYDGTTSSRGESTLSDNDSWKNRLNLTGGGSNAHGRSPVLLNGLNDVTNSTNYMTPSSNLTDLAKPPYTDSSKGSAYPNGYASSPASSRGSSKQLINDIVWLEKKIADVRKRVDRLDGDHDGSDTTGSPQRLDQSPLKSPITSDIICQDVVAPPGKLQIVIHSTKDGPAIHSVKSGSVLEGRLFAGDLILSVNDVDCRNVSAEEVMEMMARSSAEDRKLTVLHAAFHAFL